MLRRRVKNRLSHLNQIRILGTIEPIMGNRKLVSSVGEALYGQTRQAALRLFFGQSDRRFLQKEVIERIGLGSGTVQRELERLSKAEILVRTTEGRQKYYQANHRSPVFEELRGLVRKTFGATQVLQQALEPIANRIEVAFIFGSVASGTERSESDLDLLVVANDVTLSDLIPAVREAERELGREVNPSLYTPKEFSRRLAERQNFLGNVVEGPKLFLIGDEHELGRLAKVRLAEGAQDQPQRNRRTHGRGRSRPRGLEDSGSPQ